MDYKDYLKSNDWLVKKFNKLKYNRRRCAICNSLENLDLHHLNYKNLVDVDNSDLRILCRRCHFLAHDLYKIGEITFRNENHHSRFAIIKAAVKKYLGISNVNMFAT